MMLGSQYACRSRPTRWFRSDLSLMRERSYLMKHFPWAILYMVGSMLIMSFMVGEAGMKCLETHEISTTFIHLRALLCLGVAAHALKADMLEACPGERASRNVCQRSYMVHRD